MVQAVVVVVWGKGPGEPVPSAQVPIVGFAISRGVQVAGWHLHCTEWKVVTRQLL